MNKVTIDGTLYHREELCKRTPAPFAADSPSHRQLSLFLKEWFSPTPVLTLHTSGSTGRPKEITVRKEQMLQSAAITCDFFGMKAGERALLCLPLQYIAGKMMVVRAIYAGLNLLVAEPSGHPLAGIPQRVDFAAMVPLQVYNSLQTDNEQARLSRVARLIIGGGAIDQAIEERLRYFPNAIYSTYGMTETVSHIALRRISGVKADDCYTPLPGVTLRLSEEQTLIVDAPRVADGILHTNDIAEMRPDGSFRILGRKDNVINSGGIKIQIEEVEKALRPHISGDFAITSVPHPRLGEAVVLLIGPGSDPDRVREAVSQHLPRVQQPLYLLSVEAVPHTGNGKTDRTASKIMASEKIQMPGIR